MPLRAGGVFAEAEFAAGFDPEGLFFGGVGQHALVLHEIILFGAAYDEVFHIEEPAEAPYSGQPQARKPGAQTRGRA